MKPLLALLSVCLLAGCGGSGGGDDGDWSWTFISGGGPPPDGGSTIIVTGHGKAAPTFAFGEPFLFEGEVPPPDSAALALPPPDGFLLLDAVTTPGGSVRLLEAAGGFPALLLEGDFPQPVPIPAVRVLLAAPAPLALHLLAADGTAIRADLEIAADSARD